MILNTSSKPDFTGSFELGCAASFNDFPKRRWVLSKILCFERGPENHTVAESFTFEFSRVTRHKQKKESRSLTVLHSKITGMQNEGDMTIFTFKDREDAERVLIAIRDKNGEVKRLHVS